MIKTSKIALLILTTQALTFVSIAAPDMAPEKVSGPHNPDHSVRVVEEPTTFPWAKSRGQHLTPESIGEVNKLMDEASKEGLVPVFLCGDIQARALNLCYPNTTILTPAMLVNYDGSMKAAPGVTFFTTVTPETREEIGRALGYL